jgi:hypothetical protein
VVAGQQSKTKESSECSIHDEGLLEHPIKSKKLAAINTSPAMAKNEVGF